MTYEIHEPLDRLEAAERAVTEAYQRGYATGQEEIEKERDALRAALRHEADCVEAAKAEIASLRASLQVALSVLNDVRGNINPERGYADELEEDVENAIASIILRAS